MMRHFRTYIAIAATVLLITLPSCIHNDIPYPRIQPNFTVFEVTGQDEGTVIDSISRTITLHFGEDVNLAEVTVDTFALTAGASVVSPDLDQPLDLTEPLDVTLRLYQDWVWTINAVQEIERWFTVDGQVGTSTIDVPGHRVVAHVSKNTPLTSITVTSIKLGPDGSTMTPDLMEPGLTVDFTHPVEVLVKSFGRSTTWTIYVEQTEATVETVRADAWTCVAWVYGQAEAGRDNGVEYRLKGDTDWVRVAEDQITSDGGSFYARIIHLSPQTTYEARAYSGTEYGAAVTFTTGQALQVPNSNFDNWWLDGKIWCPWAQDAEPYWGTGNKGATTIGSSNSVPTDETVSGQGWAAKLETVFAGIGMLGKLAAGNIFIGSYVRTDGTNGILSFGREFTERPTKLKGYLKYKTAPISHTSSEFTDMKGKDDTGIIWIALIDQDTPFEIRTNPKNRQLFDPEGSYVVAYGKAEYNQDVPQYIPFEITLDYRSTQRVPKYLLITASASSLGDYFTGGVGATLYLDDFELVYDY